jgi:hypothetical protein
MLYVSMNIGYGTSRELNKHDKRELKAAERSWGARRRALDNAVRALMRETAHWAVSPVRGFTEEEAEQQFRDLLPKQVKR